MLLEPSWVSSICQRFEAERVWGPGVWARGSPVSVGRRERAASAGVEAVSRRLHLLELRELAAEAQHEQHDQH
eukprot:scaffold40490_cov63-Phaeocystis_antarctica.AAC.3